MTTTKATLVKVEKSNRQYKKWQAIFSDGRTVHFGDNRYEDYTQHKDKARRALYLQRHAKDPTDPYTAGNLSRHLLWGDSTSLELNIKAYKKKYGI